MRLLSLLLTLYIYISTVYAGHHANLYRLHQSLYETKHIWTSKQIASVTTLNFTQPLDHFNEQDIRTWEQRYHINTEFEIDNEGPIFVYIGGEGALGSSSVVRGEIYDNARLHNATIVGVEHRYYGLSVPQLFLDLETDNLRWLTSQQALADLANILTTLKSSRAGWANKKIFTWGGSYPGALSAWFRLKYPHITVGSVASSAPVRATESFYEYDQSVATAIGETCATKIQQATSLIEAQLASNSVATKTKFGCEAIKNDVSFLYVLADAVAWAVQYSKTNGTAYYGLCEIMEKSGDLVDNYVTFLNKVLEENRNSTCVAFSTSEETLGDITIDEKNNGRQWYYQSCNEFGYFQTAPLAPLFSLRSRQIDVEYHRQLCSTVFNNRTMKPHIEFTNAEYGSDMTAGSNIIFVNGNIDPWHKLSIIAPIPSYPTEIPVYINGTSHCADLGSHTDHDLPSLTAARIQIRDIISQWLSEDSVTACPSYMTICNGRCVDIQNDPKHCGACNNDITILTDRYCSQGSSLDASPVSKIGKELIIIGAVCTLIGVVALIFATRTLKKAKILQEQQGQDYSALRA